MITEEQLESLGFKHTATLKNGGSKYYSNQELELLVVWNGNNSIYKRRYPNRLSEVEIKKIRKGKGAHEFPTLFRGLISFESFKSRLNAFSGS